MVSNCNLSRLLVPQAFELPLALYFISFFFFFFFLILLPFFILIFIVYLYSICDIEVVERNALVILKLVGLFAAFDY